MGLQPSTVTCQCSTTTTDYATGWLTFVDDNGNANKSEASDKDGDVDENETVLQHVTNDYTVAKNLTRVKRTVVIQLLKRGCPITRWRKRPTHFDKGVTRR